MLFKNSAALVALCASAASAIYSNGTNESNSTKVTTTLSPNYSVNPIVSTYTYSDETTTFYVTNTAFTTIWATTNVATGSATAAVTTASSTDEDSTTKVNGQNKDIENVSVSADDSKTSATVTSTLYTTYTQWSTSTDSVAKNEGSGDNGCVPVTQYVTVTAEPATQYVTVTAQPTSFQWSNATDSAWSNSTVTN